ncbi:MAG: DUF2066 domain-containing protein [Steroidobacteraceae bacterium]
MTTALRRVGRLLTLLTCAALPAVCLASRKVPVFTVDTAAQTPAALAQALQTVLVRATGHTAAAEDPQLAALTSHAAQYVQGYQQGPTGTLQVTFQAGPLEQAIRAAGRNLWNADRPFTLVVLSPPPAALEQATDDASVQQAAERRGLPISIMPLTVRTADGPLLPSVALLAMAHNFGAEQLLIGREVTANALDPPGATAASAAPAASAGVGADAAVSVPETWHWTLVTPFATRQFTGSVTSGIDQTVDWLAPPLQAVPGGGIAKTQVRIVGLRTLADYAQAETMLAAVPGVHQSTVRQIDGSTVEFELWARGGAASLRQMLSWSPRLKPQASDRGLTYRYVPPPPAPPAPTASSPPPLSAAARSGTPAPASDSPAAPSP